MEHAEVGRYLYAGVLVTVNLQATHMSLFLSLCTQSCTQTCSFQSKKHQLKPSIRVRSLQFSSILSFDNTVDGPAKI